MNAAQAQYAQANLTPAQRATLLRQAQVQQAQAQSQAQVQAHAQPQQAQLGRTRKTTALVDYNDAFVRAAKRRKATDRTIPLFTPEEESKTAQSDAVLQEWSKGYKQLTDLEKKLDWTISRKRTEFSDRIGHTGLYKAIAGSSMSGGKLRGVRRTFRVALSHQLGKSEASSTTASSWTFKIDGRLIDQDEDDPDRKFNTLVSGLSVEWGDSNRVDWSRPAVPSDMDGVTMTRSFAPQQTSVTLKISLHLDQHPERYKLTPELSGMLGLTEATRNGVTSAVWSYIKKNNLQDAENKGVIRLDSQLRAACSHTPQPTVPLNHLAEYITRGLSRPDPVVLEYTIDGLSSSFDTFSDPQAYDLTMEIEDPLRAKLAACLESLSSSQNQELVAQDEKMANTAALIRSKKDRRDFLADFAADPQGFIVDWLESQAHDIETSFNSEATSLGALSADAEMLRRSDFWTRQAWLDNALDVFASRGVAAPRPQPGQQQQPQMTAQQLQALSSLQAQAQAQTAAQGQRR